MNAPRHNKRSAVTDTVAERIFPLRDLKLSFSMMPPLHLIEYEMQAAGNNVLTGPARNFHPADFLLPARLPDGAVKGSNPHLVSLIIL
jgi:hypothetical protein